MRPLDFPVLTDENIAADVVAMVGAGHARMLAYQDKRYAELYTRRMQRILAAERASDPRGRIVAPGQRGGQPCATRPHRIARHPAGRPEPAVARAADGIERSEFASERLGSYRSFRRWASG